MRPKLFPMPTAGALRAAAIALIALIASGCWDRTEVNDLAIVNGVALDKAGPRSIEVTLSLAVPSRITPPGSPRGGGAMQPPTTTVSAQGRTVEDALARMQEKLSRRLYFGHNSVLLIGEDLAKQGIAPVVEFFTRHRQPRLRTFVGVSSGMARDVLAAIPPLEPVTPTAIREIATFRTSVLVTMRDVATMLTSEGQEPLTAKVGVVHSGSPEPGKLEESQGGGGGGGGSGGDSGGSGGGSGGGAQKPTAEGPPQPAITGAAVFKGDKLVGFLNDREARGVLWLRNELQTAFITVPIGETGKWVSHMLIRTTAELKPRFEGDRIIMQVNIRTEDDLDENAAGVDASDPRVIKLLEKEISKIIAAWIRQSAEKVQKEFKSDVFRFGEAVRRADPQRWKQLKDGWDQEFPNVELAVNVQAFIRRTGLSAKPLVIKEQGILKEEDLRRILERK